MQKPALRSSRTVFRGFFDVRTDLLARSDGELFDYTSMVLPVDAAIIVAEDTEGRLILNREYRHPTREWILGCPGGRLERAKMRSSADGGSSWKKRDTRPKRAFISDHVFHCRAFATRKSSLSMRKKRHEKRAAKPRSFRMHRNSLLNDADELRPCDPNGTQIDGSHASRPFGYNELLRHANIIPMTSLPKALRSEERRREVVCRFGKRRHYFKADPASRNKPPYCIVIPPPNVTGVLHMGHALVDTLQDILIRLSGCRALRRSGCLARPCRHLPRRPSSSAISLPNRAPAQDFPARRVSRPRLGMERAERRPDPSPVEKARLLLRLVALPLHHGRRVQSRRPHSLQENVR